MLETSIDIRAPLKYILTIPIFSIAVNDALDDILADSDDEEEEAAIVNKVLDEIGIEISGKVRNPVSSVVATF